MTPGATISEVLSQAARGRGAILSRRGFREFEGVSASELKGMLHDLLRHDDPCAGQSSRDMLGEKEAATLGHAPAWIDAGAVYEDLLSAVKARGPLDTIICLDPWVAQLRSPVAETASKSNWILISDLAERKTKGEGEYWETLEKWLEGLSFSAVLPRSAFVEVPAGRESSPRRHSPGGAIAEKPGAWRWHLVTSPPASPSTILLVRYSGSLGHLRTFLESLARQDLPRESFGCLILQGSEGEDPGTTLRWMGLAHPDLRIKLLATFSEWKPELRRLLEDAPEAVLVMSGDHTVLPTDFIRKVEGGLRGGVVGVRVPLEATAHILTGNLDPLSNYEILLEGCAKDPGARRESLRIIPPERWRSGEGDLGDRLARMAKEGGSTGAAPSLTLLELEDLP